MGGSYSRGHHAHPTGTESGETEEGMRASPAPLTSISFTLNGEAVRVEGARVQTRLVCWLREQPGFTGTKLMCGEGGCGCCVVAATRVDPVTEKETTVAINSCLCPLYSIDGWHITTVEGIGSSTKGYHPIQKRLVAHNGSQCGYCTPGFVMNMYSLLQQNPTPTKQQIEESFGGNICRCTGYRPILDSMKSFAVDADPSEGGCIDIEELGSPKLCPSSGKPCTGKREHCQVHRVMESAPKWYKPASFFELFGIASAAPDCSKIRLVAGDTGRGVFKGHEKFEIYIDLKGIGDLYKSEVSESSLTVGAAISITDLILLLQDNKDKSVTFEHLAYHLLQIASVPVRNAGTWAGNLMLPHDHDNFPSDVFTAMAAVGAKVTVGYVTSPTSWDHKTMTLWDFLSYDMTKSLIVSLEIPFAASNVVFRSFKVMPRAQNAHAFVNAAFQAEVDPSTLVVKGRPSLVYGGIGTHAVSAGDTESFLEGKKLTDLETLKGALECLSKELTPNAPPASTSPQYRKSLAISLFYKFYLAAIGSHTSPAVLSASVHYKREVSQGKQTYSTKPTEYPVTEPMTKLTALLQTSGEAQYTTDIPTQPEELAAAFVLTTQANAKITKMDFSQAEQIPGFVKIIIAGDIPGNNSFTLPPECVEEPVLATDFSEYAGMPVAIAVADNQWSVLAVAAVAAAGVEYESLGKPILTIQEAIAAGSFFEYDKKPTVVGDAESAISASEHTIEGEVSMGSQYHFHMETQVSLCVPVEDGFQVYSSTQWPSFTQAAIANVLNIPANTIDVSVKRVGGAYGGKIIRASWIAAATALAASATRKPVRMHMDLESNMKVVGKRCPYYATYKVGSTKDGIINGISATVYADMGCNENDQCLFAALEMLDNAYHVPNWLMTPKLVKTNTPSHTYTRSPGTVQGIFIAETMLDHLATSLGLPVEELKRKHLYQKDQVTPHGMTLTYCNIISLWDQFYKTSDFARRKSEVEVFNKTNRWRKRGINMVPMRFNMEWAGLMYSTQVSVYQADGTVAISHGGIEVGQGINTKVAQVAAKTLGIPIDQIKIKPTTSLISPNDAYTGQSLTSERCCKSVLIACQELVSRMAPVKEKHPDASWVELVKLCHKSGIDLGARAICNPAEKVGPVYNSYGVTCSEVEVDVLTGQTQVLRVDILYDCGDSLSPEIDVGQVEGAFIMGVGNLLSERLIYDEDNGQLLTHNTWEYKPPGAQDIPIDFRVEFLKDAPNPVGVLRSKASGEPPQCMSCSVLFAVKRAIESARAETGNTDYFTLNGPATVDLIQQACLVDPNQFSF